VPWGAGVEPAALAAVLEREGPFDAVTLVSNETSTGVRTPLAGIAEVMARFPETQLLVDLVSYLAGAPVDFDANGIDFGFAGSQKALALPPGITVACVSQRYLERARGRELRGWYLDPVRIVSGHETRKTPATPCIPLYYALARQLEDISAGRTLPARDAGRSGADAWRARFEKHERMRRRTLEWACGRGLRPYPAERFTSPTVACIASDGIDTAAFVSGLKQRGFEISNGYGDLKNKSFRIGHMGDHSEEGLESLLAAADAVLG
jgi:aspartate aminotransferase-like enzyme